MFQPFVQLKQLLVLKLSRPQFFASLVEGVLLLLDSLPQVLVLRLKFVRVGLKVKCVVFDAVFHLSQVQPRYGTL